MSFQVGDAVVHVVMPEVYTVTHIDGLFVSCVSGDGVGGYFMGMIRHATQQEIAAGHRIDHSVHDNEMIELSGNSEELEVLEMIDVSPNCEVSEL